MTSRERVLAVLNHEKPDRVPIDFGSTVFTTITANAYRNLKKYLNINSADKLSHFVFQTAEVDEEVLNRFNVDTRGLINKSRKGWIDKIDENRIHIDEWGVKRKVSDGGYLEIISSPFESNFSQKAIEEFSWPDGTDPGRVEGLPEKNKKYKQTGDYARILYIFGGITTMSMFLRGFQNWFFDLVENRKLLEELLDRLLQFQMDSARTAIEALNGDIDIVAIADDFADQRNMMFAPEYYREIIKPRDRKLFGMVKEMCNAKVLFHSCGNISSIIEDLIDIGVDAINPVQVTANGMDPETLKSNFGGRICFWGGIDSQNLLPNGSAADVRNEVKRLIETLGKNGGYVLNGVHNIQDDVPPENVAAMFEAGREFGTYIKE